MNLARTIKSYRKDFLQLIYPQYCYACNSELVGSSSGICPICEADLSYTLFEHYEHPTPLDQLFWGRVKLEATFALLHFNKEGATQKILHDLKYNSRSELGRYYGEEMGKRLMCMKAMQDLTGIIPVPIHPKKEFIRGYNQAEEIAVGLASVLELPVEHQLLKRKVFSESQTKKGLLSRWENMQEVFKAGKEKAKAGHFLIVDDVITTGSTLEVCVKELQQKFPGIRISVATLAVAG